MLHTMLCDVFDFFYALVLFFFLVIRKSVSREKKNLSKIPKANGSVVRRVV
jgi:hypothetical protein